MGLFFIVCFIHKKIIKQHSERVARVSTILNNAKNWSKRKNFIYKIYTSFLYKRAVFAYGLFSQGGLIISLINIAGSSVCGSSLVSHNRLVTAAHCWFDGRNQAWQFLVVLGSPMLFSGGTRIATSNVVVHPQWLPSMLLNDVAVIYLPTNVFFSCEYSKYINTSWPGRSCAAIPSSQILIEQEIK